MENERQLVERYSDRATFKLEMIFLDEHKEIPVGEFARKMALSADNEGKYEVGKVGVEEYRMRGFTSGRVREVGFVDRLYSVYFEHGDAIPANDYSLGSLEKDDFPERRMEAVQDSFRLSFFEWDELGRPLTLDFEREEKYYLPKEKAK